MDEMTYTVTMTAKELAFRERARAAGIPAMMVSMYEGALQRLVEDEREECAKMCDEFSKLLTLNPTIGDCAAAIRARGKE
jgi:hypothetical protein